MLTKIKYFFEESWLLMVSAFVFGGLLALTDAAWSAKIKQNAAAKFDNLAVTVLKGAQRFEPLSTAPTLNLNKGKQVTVDIRKGLDAADNCVGWVFVAEGPGFADKIKLVVAVDAAFSVVQGFSVLASNETPGFGDKIAIKDGFYQSQYKGAPVGTFTLTKGGDHKIIDTEIVAITGATVTSQAVVNIMNSYVAPLKEQLVQQGLIN